MVKKVVNHRNDGIGPFSNIEGFVDQVRYLLKHNNIIITEL